MGDLRTQLDVFTTNPLVPWKNTPLERGLRGPVDGRKTKHGSQSQRGTQVAAVMTGKLLDVSVARCLTTLAAEPLASDQPVVQLPHECRADVEAQA